MGNSNNDGVEQDERLVSAEQMQSARLTIDKWLDLTHIAVQSSITVDETLNNMLGVCRSTASGHHDKSVGADKFEALKSTCFNTIDCYENSVKEARLAADDAPRVSQSDADRIPALGTLLPEFTAFKQPLYTSHRPEDKLTINELSAFISQYLQNRPHQGATVQGVRIFSRFPGDLVTGPHKAINSLACVTGTTVGVLGNAMYAQMPAKCLGAPLSEGELAINTIEIAGCNGEADALVDAINQKSDEHKSQAVLTADRRIVIFRVDGEAIRLAVRSRSASIVSGFNMGIKLCQARTLGVPVWMKMPHIAGTENSALQPTNLTGDDSAAADLSAATQSVRFDSLKTGLALTGKAISELTLNRVDWCNLHCSDEPSARFAELLLGHLRQQLVRQSECLLQQIRQVRHWLEQQGHSLSSQLANRLQQLDSLFAPSIHGPRRVSYH